MVGETGFQISEFCFGDVKWEGLRFRCVDFVSRQGSITGKFRVEIGREILGCVRVRITF